MFDLIFSVLLLLILAVGIYVLVKPFGFQDRNGEIEGRGAVRAGAGVVIAVTVLLLALMSVKSVGATEVGVPVTLGAPGAPIGPGPTVVLPWTDVRTLDVKTQTLDLDDDNEIKTVTADRVQTPVDVSVYFHVDSEKAPTLLLTVGEDYVDKIVRPLVRSNVYDGGSKYKAEDIQQQRDAYENTVEAALRPLLAARGIVLEKVELRKIQLPDNILANAQAKINAEETQKRAKIDAETKVIEATAQAQANKILQESLTQNKDVCQLLLVEGLRKKEIEGPLYVNPCGTDTGTSPLLTRSTN